jgi:nucleoside-diphosphate-sugar epimerase
MTATMHTVLGASGGAGSAIALALRDADIPTRAVSRSKPALPADIEVASADITDPDALVAALAGSGVVYMAAQPPYHRWSEEFPDMLEGVIVACTSVGAKLVMVDNLYAYGPGHERLTPTTPHTATDRKGIVRRQMHERLLAAHAGGDVRVAIGQASDYYGPHSDNSAVTSLAVAPIGTRGALRWIGSLDEPHSIAYLPDIARAFVALGTNDDADGRTWVLPHGEPVTGRRFIDLVNSHLDEPRKASRVSKAMLTMAAPFHRISRETLGISYQWTDPWIADDSAFQAAFGPFTPTPVEVAVAEAVAAYR